jgi:Fe-S-cluster-containing dehydrogenase component/anaerobic selenocysteine-containing dehydrogenase
VKRDSNEHLHPTEPASESETLSGAYDPLDLPNDPVSRRRFLTLLGASAALAAGSACSKIDRGGIVPAARKLRHAAPGATTQYASTFHEGSQSHSVLVKTREGRPIHVEGNDLDPRCQGKAPLRAIADVLRLYDPDRMRNSLIDGRPAPWDEVLGRLVRGVADARLSGRPIVLLTGADLSPTRRALIAELSRAFPTIEHLSWEPTASDAEQAALDACFGSAARMSPRLDKARVLVCFEADPLGGSALDGVAALARQKRSTTDGEATQRLWAIESALSLTGGKADQRLPVKAPEAARLAFALARALHERGVPLPAGVSRELLLPFDLATVAREAGLPPAEVRALVTDLLAARQAALVLVGPALPFAAHVAGHLLNAMLGADGLTQEAASIPPRSKLATLADIRALVERMRSGRVGAVLFWGVNPVYTFPDEALVRDAIQRTPVRAAIALHHDETAALCPLVFAEHHWLEAWGDHEPRPGVLTLQQPALQPLFGTRAGEDVVLGLLNHLGKSAPATYPEYLRQRWRREVHDAGALVPFERFWQAALHDGVVKRPPPAQPPRQLRAEVVATAARAVLREDRAQGLDLLLVEGPLHDGRYSNNGWLQELPDPITKLTWGNVLTLSPSDAGRLGLSDGAVVRLVAAGATLVTPIFVQLGQATGVATLAFGHGRQAGNVATGVGVNAFRLLQQSGGPTLLRNVSLTPTGTTLVLPTAQPHQLAEGRDVVRSGTHAEVMALAAAPVSVQGLATLNPPATPAEHKWGMAIDLSACTGCSACVVACQSENNIPVVGPEQVRRGRAMHWMRVDRYYDGSPDNPRVLTQPMLCQQCDHAPCESVCPVNATSHSSEGLNQMTYNRCVGTRYCANNCPYKVRRFNFLDFTSTKRAPETLAFNPEVSVRPRGVMEKCTFCVQRIEEARSQAKVARRSIREGDIAPACAVACPADAIVFGDLNDPRSRVSQLSADRRGYHVLGELGTRPAVTYLAEVKNPVQTTPSHDPTKGAGGQHGG